MGRNRWPEGLSFSRPGEEIACPLRLGQSIVFLDCCIHYGTLAAYDSLHPATCHPEASHATNYTSRFSASEAEGSAPLHHGVIRNCWDGWPEDQRSRPFALAS